MNEQFITYCRKYFPKFDIKFKNESPLMKLLGTLLFFNKGFMTSYVTTIGNTVYLTSPEEISRDQLTTEVVVLHELVHIYDANKLTRLLFGFLYLSPITLIPFALASMLLSFWFGLLAIIVCLSPVPAYFRMRFEKKAYTFSLYAAHKMALQNNRTADLDALAIRHSRQFTGAAYYFMWPFGDVESHLKQAAIEFKNGNKPYYQSEIYDMIDDIVENAGLI